MSSRARSIGRQVPKVTESTPKEVDIRTIRAKNLELSKQLAEYLSRLDPDGRQLTDDTRELSVAEFTDFLGELGDTVSELELIRTCMGEAVECTVERLGKSDEAVNAVSRSYIQGYEDDEEYYSDDDEDSDCDDESAFEEELED